MWAEYLQTAKTFHYEAKRPGAAPLDDAVLSEIQQAVERQSATVLTGDGDEREMDHSALVRLIAIRGVVIGALGIYDDEGTRQWTNDEIALVEAVTERMALAADNLRLLDETQRRAARERTVGELSTRVRETLDVDTILKTAVQEIRRTLGVSEVAIRLATQQGETRDGTG